jgi:hypothetical protein
MISFVPTLLTLMLFHRRLAQFIVLNLRYMIVIMLKENKMKKTKQNKNKAKKSEKSEKKAKKVKKCE